MSAYRIRKGCKYGMFTVHNYNDKIHAEVFGKLYYWNPNAKSGYIGAIQHGGNYLNGTEYRGPATSDGDWCEYPHLEYGRVISYSGLGYGTQFFPHVKYVTMALNGELVDGWERTNPEDGKNDEWIPLTAENVNE